MAVRGSLEGSEGQAEAPAPCAPLRWGGHNGHTGPRRGDGGIRGRIRGLVQQPANAGARARSEEAAPAAIPDDAAADVAVRCDARERGPLAGDAGRVAWPGQQPCCPETNA